MLRIELDRPARVDGQPAAPQSLWLLLALRQAARRGMPGLVEVEALDQRFGPARNPRMRITRAFADFERWGVRVGWGARSAARLSTLSLAARSRGPFWLSPGEGDAMGVFVDGRAAGDGEVDEWLQGAEQGDCPMPASTSPEGIGFWQGWADACAAGRARQWIVDGRHGVLAALRRAEAEARTPPAQAFVRLQQAMAWRRAGNADAARRVLDQMPRAILERPASGEAWLGAMANIVRAWAAYAERELVAARRLLSRVARDPRWQPVLEHHPRVRFEHTNLLALLERAVALDASHAVEARLQAADSALAHYREAYAAASTADLAEAAAAAASNLGWSLWLFKRCGLEVSAVDSPWAWLALGMQHDEAAPVGEGQWGTLYGLRMARDAGPSTPSTTRAALRAWPVLSPDALSVQCAPLVSPWRGASWLPFVRAEISAIEAGRVQVDPLLRCNLLLESAWYEAREGDLRAAADAAQHLRRRLRELASRDRGFFRQASRRLALLNLR